jgi:anti-sigma factor RsiW
MRPDTAQDCPRIEALSSLLDGEMPEIARAEIMAHAAACPLCGATLQEFRDLRSAFGALPDTGPGVDIAALIGDRLAPRTEARPTPRRIRRRWELAPAGFAAAGVLAMGAYLGMLLAGGTTVHVAQSPAMTVFSAVPPGGLCLAPTCYGRGR